MTLEKRELAKRAVERNWQRAQATVRITVQGRSMGSTLPEGAVVEVRFAERPRLTKGDIIYFRKGSRRVVHRLLARLGPLCLEKGDANKYAWWCLYSDVLGTGTVAAGS